MDNLKRVRYVKSPLKEVIFQLRYPTILSINSRQPVVFQDKIRDIYPFFEEQLEEVGNVMVNPQLNVATMKKTAENKNYAFISKDKKTKINLTPSFISISTKEYTQWEDFKKQIEFVIPLFENEYQPSFYTRVGLRYIDVIIRSELNLNEKHWTELIQPHVLGLVTQEIENGIKSYFSEMEYETKEEQVLSKAHFELVHINNQRELSLLIDCDYYILEITNLNEMKSKAEKLHTASSQFIQTAIMPVLHQAMQPVEIEI